MSSESASLDVVTHEVDGRVLSGVGVSVEDLKATMARFHDVDPPTDPTPAPQEPGSPAPIAEPPQEPQTPPPSPETAPSRSRGQKRFDELTAHAKEQERLRQAAEKERDDLKAQLAARAAPSPSPTATSAGMAPPASPSPVGAAGVSSPPTLPSLPTFPAHLQTFDAFIGAFPALSYDDFQTARIVHLQQTGAPDIDARIRQSIEADRASRSFQSRVDQVYAKGREVFPDFDAVRSGPGGQAVFPLDKVRFILDQPQAHHLIYVIAKDPALATRLIQADPVAFGFEIAALTPPSSVASPASTGRPGSATPPPPMQPVGSGSKTTVPSSAELVSGGFDFDKSGYRERRAAERGVRRQR